MVLCTTPNADRRESCSHAEKWSRRIKRRHIRQPTDKPINIYVQDGTVFDFEDIRTSAGSMVQHKLAPEMALTPLATIYTVLHPNNTPTATPS